MSTRIAIALLLGLGVGAATGVKYDAWGDGFGDMDYTYYRFLWRGRRLELHIEKADS